MFGVALAGRLKGLRGLIVGALLVGLAGAIKQPVLVFLFAVAVLSVAHLTTGYWARWRRLILPGIIAGIVGLTAFLLPGWVSGWGFGWTSATGLSAYGRSTPLRYFYELASNVSIALSGDKFRSAVPEIVPTAAMVLVILLAVCLFLVWGPQYPVEVTIFAFGFYFLLGRTVQPWYTLWFLLALVLIRMTRWRALALVGLSTWMLGAMFARPWAPVNWYTQFTWAVVAAAVAMAIFLMLSRNGQPTTHRVAADRF